jgi:Plasmid pRiA4b ORF-3-like protein
MSSSTNNSIAKLRVELEGIKPLIWRRVAVPTSMKLNALHNVVQTAMGWRDRHLWMLTAGDRNYGILIPGDDDWNARINDAETTTLAMILSGGLKEFGYVYDFGDNWEHRIIVENVKPTEQQASYPEFLGGERRCPPEDCGGIPGYYGFLDKVTAKQGKKRKAALDWYGGPYDPDDIDEQQIVMNLRSIK